MNGLRTWLFQDLVHVISKKPFQNASIASIHNTTPSWGFWSFFEFSKRDGQYLNRTKENESVEDPVDFSGALLALPQLQMSELPSSKNEITKDASIFNIQMKHLKKDVFSNLDKAKGDSGSIMEDTIVKTREMKAEKPTLEAKQVIKDANQNTITNKAEATIFEMAAKKSRLSISGPRPAQSWYGRPPRPPSIGPKNCPPAPRRPEFDAKTKCPQPPPKNKPQCPPRNDPPKGLANFQSNTKPLMIESQLKADSGSSASPFGLKTFRKKAPSKSCTDLFTSSLTNKENSVQSGSMKVDKSASIFAKGKGKSSLSFTVSVETPRFRTTKSLSSQIVSRYSSGSAPASRLSGLKVSKASLQSASMSSGNGKRNDRKKKKGRSNGQMDECPPPCTPPPQPPPCCPPPPPPCCSPSNSQKSGQRPERKKKKKCKSDDWCPSAEDKYACSESKCPKKKKRAPQPRICPPKCFEPDPCKKPKEFCVGCQPKKKKPNGKCFSTWARKRSSMIFALRSFASDKCKMNDGGKSDESNFNLKRIPKPGPTCKETGKGENKCKPAASKKDDKCAKKPAPNKKSCQESTVSSTGKKQQEETIDLVKKEYEEVEKCKQGRRKQKKPECANKKHAGKKSVDKKAANKEPAVSTGLENVISPCKLERMKKLESKNQETKCKMIAIENPIDSPYKRLLGVSQIKQTNFSESQEITQDYFPVIELRNNFWNDLNIFEGSNKGKDLRGNFVAKNLIKDQKSHDYWFPSWFR